MKNYEKYADVIKTYNDGSLYCDDIIIPNVLKPLGKSCVDTSCEVCNSLTTLWLLEEYEEPQEPKTDWSKVEVDTPILVRTVEGADWVKRNFAKYEGGMVYVWNNGKTSWTALENECVTPWQYAKLAESEEE